MPACDAGMQLVEAFLVSCGEAVDRFGEKGPGDRVAQITESYMMMVDHGNLCDDCKEADGPRSKEADDDQKRTSLLPSMKHQRITRRASSGH